MTDLADPKPWAPSAGMQRGKEREVEREMERGALGKREVKREVSEVRWGELRCAFFQFSTLFDKCSTVVISCHSKSPTVHCLFLSSNETLV